MVKSRTTRGLWAVALTLALWTAPSAAQQGPASEERAWAKGVPPESQKRALELFRQGNTLLKESVFVRAVEKYREAIALWDHPAIHYNLALALLNLDQPVEVHEHLVASLRYGAAPLDSEKFENAKAYKTLIEKQLSRVDLSCDTPGASVTLDGQVLFVGPGRYQGMVRPGQHTLVATKAGYVPTDMSRTLLPGEAVKLELKVYTAEELTRYRRQWSAWKPWAVLGAGVALAAGGSVLHMQARDSYREFDVGILSCGGCVPEPALADKRSRGDSLQKVAFGTYAVGGAALVTGAVLVYVNREQSYRITPGEASKDQEVSVAPLLGKGEGGMLATFRF
ncbi:hypothetical protein [Hyalangium rubrum]|uniref:PEGA domain-containing protein n=1 Tax=Hyalangium rubrum TaxID=3103134 RepID=A0ABU5H318_9BACT|nr:hypothetical protein [Hyalangium sp. s54d21]MDY7227294.1 hypothetical protein [Hyalangium sp. s54d21]